MAGTRDIVNGREEDGEGGGVVNESLLLGYTDSPMTSSEFINLTPGMSPELFSESPGMATLESSPLTTMILES